MLLPTLLFQAAAAASPVPSPSVLHVVPKHDELVYTFGGVAPRYRIRPGTRIVAWTEDCFDGAVKTPADLPSKMMAPGHENPQTGRFTWKAQNPATRSRSAS